MGGGEFLAVVAGDLGDEGDFGGREVFPGVFGDEAGRFLVMAFAGGGLRPADVVEEGGEAEPLPFRESALVPGEEGDEKLVRKVGDVADVGRFLLVFFEERLGLGQGGEGGQGFGEGGSAHAPSFMSWSRMP